jgi:FG-GAP-like repeat
MQGPQRGCLSTRGLTKATCHAQNNSAFCVRHLASTILGSASGSGAVEFAPAAVYSVGAKPDAVVVGDFNADGKPDIAVANAGSSNVSILLGSGAGAFLAPRNLDLGATSGADLTLAAGDFNGDHKLDLVVYIHGFALRLYPGNNDGTFQSLVSLSGTGTHLFGGRQLGWKTGSDCGLLE